MKKSSVDDGIIESLAAKTLNGIPRQSIEMCTEISRFAEEAAASGNLEYLSRMSTIEDQVRKRLYGGS